MGRFIPCHSNDPALVSLSIYFLFVASGKKKKKKRLREKDTIERKILKERKGWVSGVGKSNREELPGPSLVRISLHSVEPLSHAPMVTALWPVMFLLFLCYILHSSDTILSLLLLFGSYIVFLSVYWYWQTPSQSISLFDWIIDSPQISIHCYHVFVWTYYQYLNMILIPSYKYYPSHEGLWEVLLSYHPKLHDRCFTYSFKSNVVPLVSVYW